MGIKAENRSFRLYPSHRLLQQKKKGFSFQTNCGGLSGYVNTFEIGREKQSKISKNLHMEHRHFWGERVGRNFGINNVKRSS